VNYWSTGPCFFYYALVRTHCALIGLHASIFNLGLFIGDGKLILRQIMQEIKSICSNFTVFSLILFGA
jgi:hypothetical protein